VPQQGRLRRCDRAGRLDVEPQEIAVDAARGSAFRVELLDGSARGYVCENYGAPFRLPELGPIGSNGLANPRDFSRTSGLVRRTAKATLRWSRSSAGNLWTATIDHSPLDVVAWHGNTWPTNTICALQCDRLDQLRSPDPSIFLVLQSQSDTPGSTRSIS
jgi:homogentisate 1,2-dioxygenase